MRTDYKLCRLTRDGTSLRVRFRVYEGDVTTEEEFHHGEMRRRPVTRYRRSRLLREEEVLLTGDRGQMTDDQLRKWLNLELRKDTARSPIPEQTDAN